MQFLSKVIYGLLLGLFLLSGAASQAAVADSVGVEVRDGQQFIQYKVTAGETVYSIARKYNLKTNEVLKYNPWAEKGLQIGQILLIPVITEAVETPPSVAGLVSGEQTHTVAVDETLFSISRQYKVKIKALRKRNNLPNNQIGLGQVLIIPLSAKEVKEAAQEVPSPITIKPGEPIYHIVIEDETLYSLSREYGVSATDIQKWNGLPGNQINLGQRLIVGYHQEVTEETAGTTVEVKDPEPTEIPVVQVEDEQPAAEELPVASPAETPDPATTDPIDTLVSSGFDQVVDEGLAEVIEGNTDHRRFLGLHRSAPIGTLMQVVNEMNNQKIFVRIVGRITDTGDNAKVKIKISKAAYDRLGAVASRFPVVISYVP